MDEQSHFGLVDGGHLNVEQFDFGVQKRDLVFGKKDKVRERVLNDGPLMLAQSGEGEYSWQNVLSVGEHSQPGERREPDEHQFQVDIARNRVFESDQEMIGVQLNPLDQRREVQIQSHVRSRREKRPIGRLYELKSGGGQVGNCGVGSVTVDPQSPCSRNRDRNRNLEFESELGCAQILGELLQGRGDQGGGRGRRDVLELDSFDFSEFGDHFE